MKFSILISVYNVETYLNECIQSVLMQTFQDYEIILVDDGSTDRSGVICDGYAKKNTKVKVFHKQNSGQLHTREYAISKASGEWYVFLDSDDMLKSSALATINQYTDSSDCVIYGYERVLNDTVICSQHDKCTKQIMDKNYIYNKVFFDTAYNALWRKAVRATVFENPDYSEYYHISLGEDLLQSLEILKNSKIVTFIPDVLYQYRVNPSSVTQSVSFEKYSVDYTVRQKVLEFLYDERVFSKKDYDAYRDFSINANLIHELIVISHFDTVRKNKIVLFERIRNSNYYIQFLSKGYSRNYKSIKNKVVFWLFSNGYNGMLIELLNLYKIIKK